jgi:hypothetical protein
MNNYLQTITLFLFLLMALSSKPVTASEDFNATDYLLEAKNCFVSEDFRSDNRNELPSYLKRYLEQVDVEDYVSHRFLKSGELLIQFKKNQGDKSFSIEIEIDLNKEKGCGRVTVGEILS